MAVTQQQINEYVAELNRQINAGTISPQAAAAATQQAMQATGVTADQLATGVSSYTGQPATAADVNNFLSAGPASGGMSAAQFAQHDPAIRAALGQPPLPGAVPQGTLSGLQNQPAAASPLDVFKHDFKVDQGGTLTIDGKPLTDQQNAESSTPGTIGWAAAFMTNPAYANFVPLVKQQLAATGTLTPDLAMQIARTGNPNADDSPFMKALVSAGVFGMLGAGIAGGGLMGGNLAEYGGNLAASGGTTAVGSAGNDLLNIDPSAPGYVPPNTPQIPATAQLPSIPSQGVLSGLQNVPTPSVGVDPSAPGYVPPNTPQVPATGQLPASTGFTPPGTGGPTGIDPTTGMPIAQTPATAQLPATTPPPPVGSGAGGPTGINPANGLPLSTAATAGTALSRVLDGTASAADWASFLGTAGATALGAKSASDQLDYLKSVDARNWGAGQQSRDINSYLLTPGADISKIPGLSGAIDASSKGLLAQLSAKDGNPYGSPGGLTQATTDITNKVALPAYQWAVNQSANQGGLGALASASANSGTNVAGASGGTLNALQAGLGALTAPTPTTSQFGNIDWSKFRLTPV